MALKSTVHKADLSVSDLDRHYYQDHFLTLARHPSETNERMMVRVVAFALNADEHLEFGKRDPVVRVEPPVEGGTDARTNREGQTQQLQFAVCSQDVGRHITLFQSFLA